MTTNLSPSSIGGLGAEVVQSVNYIISKELIVVDEYLEATAEFLVHQAKSYQSAMEAYMAIVNDIRQNALVAGETAQAFEEFILQVEKLTDRIPSVARKSRVDVLTFLQDIDDADQFLY